ncbi:helix-turn-helix domain protein [Thermobaculum terrenum ATCC BAA-798]|uniref:Helix-turn-helix domain protein n=1 Tax=Thermobaculum terrenum (strain ATCC BAA-798 / CCMEE 7001 / YNP1) TaxID=525904 RepID=D1CFS7_THET1|nr:helix-turn-helix transcriptional regulator [Thermobaculum terrenum]ACZ41783.1 helix-turn-helix domain protein [Thermobaculum terrenum ATCC BAA-798]
MAQHHEDYGREYESPSLSKAINDIMRTRGMTATQVAANMKSGRNRATLYRILSGATQDPKISTFIDICQALEVSPIEVLQLAGMADHKPRDTDLLDIRMRQIFRRIQNLPYNLRKLAVSQIGALTDAIYDHLQRQENKGS